MNRYVAKTLFLILTVITSLSIYSSVVKNVIATSANFASTGKCQIICLNAIVSDEILSSSCHKKNVSFLIHFTLNESIPMSYLENCKPDIQSELEVMLAQQFAYYGTEGSDVYFQKLVGLTKKLSIELAEQYFYAAILENRSGRSENALYYLTLAAETKKKHHISESDIFYRAGHMSSLSNKSGQINWQASAESFKLANQWNNFKITKHPDDSFYLYSYAQHQIGNFPEAIDGYYETLDRYPNHYWAKVYLARILWKQNSNYSEAEGLLLSINSASPSQSGHLLTLARMQTEKGNYNEAIEYYIRFLDINPENDAAQSELLDLQKINS